ncbi:MAG: hypothetical protein HY342_07255 [Candidatus Lambdaproteobacteria bacterium]|nr:hypothetical protein [Candidatus Lambdaproteobacteria bacterium]
MAYRRIDSIAFLPIVHYRLEFAQAVRRALLDDPPEVVAVEFPGTWREPILQAVNRLPFLSLILGESGAGHLYLPVEPTDGGIEALRTARELGLPVELIDLDVEQYPLHREPVPDSHAVTRLGYARYLDELLARAAPPPGPQDAQRETMMAHALQRLAGDGRRVTCVLGAAHLPGVLDRLRAPQPRPMARSKPRTLRLYNWASDSAREYQAEAPFLAAAYERARTRPQSARTTPFAVGPLADIRAQVAAEDATAAGQQPDMDRERETELLLHQAAGAYAERFQFQVSPQQMRTLARFAKKYALVERLLVPDLFHLVTAARGVVDDDFAYELWELGIHYPWQDGSGLLPSADLDETFAFAEGRRLTLRRKLRRHRPELRHFSQRKRLREKHGEQWRADWSGATICSHPPEDLVIEDYGRFLKQRAQSMVSAGRTRVEPFSASIKDGVDVRETIRNWSERTLYVREELPAAGEVGSVVVIFDEDLPPGAGDNPFAARAVERYPWQVTWLGEHNQESDMAFYATPAGEQVVGPGISRCEYGGFVMSTPPRRMADVWNDPYFLPARSKPEVLLLAALDYSVERNVVYVAPHPPRAWFKSIAGRMGRRLVYLPLSALAPDTLRKVRTFHVLEGHAVRDYAREYID